MLVGNALLCGGMPEGFPLPTLVKKDGTMLNSACPAPPPQQPSLPPAPVRIPATVEFDLELQGITADLSAVPAAHLVDALVASAGLPDSVHALAINYTYYRMYATIALPGVQWSDAVRAAVQYAGGQAVRGFWRCFQTLSPCY